MIFEYLISYVFFKNKVRPGHIYLFSLIEHFNHQNAKIISLIMKDKIFY